MTRPAVAAMDAAVPPPPARRFARWLPWAVVAVLVTLLLVALLVVLRAPFADEDSLTDVGRSIGRLSDLTSDLRWPLVLPLALAAALHYCCAAVALQAVAGCRLPLGRRVLAQLAAATANRLTPAGLGGAAVNARFLGASGQVPAAAAVSAVAALAVVGALSDLALLGLLLGGAAIAGVHAPPAELAAVRHRVAHLLTNTGIVTALVLIVLALLALAVHRRRRLSAGKPAVKDGLAKRLADARQELLRLIRCPRDLARATGASAATTLLMGLGLASAVAAVPGPTGHVSLITLVIAYMVGAAAASAAPTPAGLGVTEAGLVAALTFCNVPTTHAVQSVLLFRVVSFWAPALVGLLALRILRSRHWI